MGDMFLVTGATGNVGRHVIDHLIGGGASVRAAIGPGEVLTPRPGLEAVPFDFRQPATWEPSLVGVERLFLLRPPAIADVKRTLNPFIDRAIAAGARHVVFLSVAGAERARFIPHAKVEAHLRRCDVAWTFLRAGFFADNIGTAYRDDIATDDRLYVPAGRGRVAFVDGLDLGAVAARALAAPDAFASRALHLTGPRAWTFDEVAALLSAELGRPIRYEAASLLGYARHLRRGGLSWGQTSVLTLLHAQLRRGGAEAVTDTVEAVLGRPPTPLADYVRRTCAVWGAAHAHAAA